IERIIIRGHGNGGAAGAFSSSQLANDQSDQSRFLDGLRQYICADSCMIDLLACRTADSVQKTLMKRISSRTGATVTGWDDTYNVIPFGREWRATPDGNLEMVGDTGRRSDEEEKKEKGCCCIKKKRK